MSLNREEETLAALGAFAGTRVELVPSTLTWQSLAQRILQIAELNVSNSQQDLSKFDAEDILVGTPEDENDDLFKVTDDMLSELVRYGILSVWNDFFPSPEGAYITQRYSLHSNPLDSSIQHSYAQRVAYLQRVADNGDITPPPLPQH